MPLSEEHVLVIIVEENLEFKRDEDVLEEVEKFCYQGDFPFYLPIHLSDYCSSQKCIFQCSGCLNSKNPIIN